MNDVSNHKVDFKQSFLPSDRRSCHRERMCTASLISSGSHNSSCLVVGLVVHEHLGSAIAEKGI